MKRLALIAAILVMWALTAHAETMYFECKPNQINRYKFSIMSTKKDPDTLDTIPNAKAVYQDQSKAILHVLIIGHGVKQLHERLFKFDSVEDPTPEEQAKMDKFAAVKAKKHTEYSLTDATMDELGIKADYLGRTLADVFGVYPELEGQIVPHVWIGAD